MSLSAIMEALAVHTLLIRLSLYFVSAQLMPLVRDLNSRHVARAVNSRIPGKFLHKCWMSFSSETHVIRARKLVTLVSQIEARVRSMLNLGLTPLLYVTRSATLMIPVSSPCCLISVLPPYSRPRHLRSLMIISRLLKRVMKQGIHEIQDTRYDEVSDTLKG